jgi:hypothetical protein
MTALLPDITGFTVCSGKVPDSIGLIEFNNVLYSSNELIDSLYT